MRNESKPFDVRPMENRRERLGKNIRSHGTCGYPMCGEGVCFELFSNEVISDVDVFEVWGIRLGVCDG